MGELLGKMEKQGPGENKRLHDATVQPSLSDLSIEKTQSHCYQRMIIKDFVKLIYLVCFAGLFKA